MEAVIRDFKTAHVNGQGYLLASTLSPLNTSEAPKRLVKFYQSTNHQQVRADLDQQIKLVRKSAPQLSKKEADHWIDVYVAYWKAVGEVLKAEDATRNGATQNWSLVYDAWKELTNALHRGYTNGDFEAWTVPCMYTLGKHLRVFAIRADKEIEETGNGVRGGFHDEENPESEKNIKLEDAARVLNRLFQLCVADRAPLETSRKWGIYNIINLLFKTYFKLNSISLSKNVINAMKASRGDMPDLEQFPKAHQVTYKYYLGVISFLDENYTEAETHLTEAWQLCLKGATRNKELILTYLIPCHLLTTHTLPSKALLRPYPRLQKLFGPLSVCIRRGDLAGFDESLAKGEDEFVKRRIYLTLERGRDIALRNLLRKVFIAGGFEAAKDGAAPARRTRVPVAEFAIAISLGSRERVDNDEVECLMANMIYKNLMKGYISRAHGMVVLAKGGAFPGTGV